MPARWAIRSTFRRLQENSHSHWMFKDVAPNGPAHNTGLDTGDILVSLNGQADFESPDLWPAETNWLLKSGTEAQCIIPSLHHRALHLVLSSIPKWRQYRLSAPYPSTGFRSISLGRKRQSRSQIVHGAQPCSKEPCPLYDQIPFRDTSSKLRPVRRPMLPCR